MKTRMNTILIGSILTILILICGYIFPDFGLRKMIDYLNSTSALIIMLLTFAYVITTNKQLFAMKEQLELIKKETNLQIQPILEPEIKKIRLEKIKAFIAPEDHFLKARILSRLFCDLNLINIGNGVALNVSVYPVIILKELKIPAPSLHPKLTHNVSENKTGDRTVHIMMLDNDMEIARAIINGRAKLNLTIYYKNIFGIGFKEEISFALLAHGEDKEKWEQFFNELYADMDLDIKKHNAIKPISKTDANSIFTEINRKLERAIDSYLELDYRVLPESYKIDIVNFEKSVKEAEANNENLFSEYFKGTYEIMKKNLSKK